MKELVFFRPRRSIIWSHIKSGRGKAACCPDSAHTSLAPANRTHRSDPATPGMADAGAASRVVPSVSYCRLWLSHHHFKSLLSYNVDICSPNLRSSENRKIENLTIQPDFGQKNYIQFNEYSLSTGPTLTGCWEYSKKLENTIRTLTQLH